MVTERCPGLNRHSRAICHPMRQSSLKAPVLPTKPLRISSALVGKGYTAAGQAGACLHTMAVLQAYQADLLKELDEGEQISSSDVGELRRTADLALRATKETARAIGRSMAALVAAERHLWLTLSDMKEKDRVFLMDVPLAPSGLFGDAVDSVVDRYQEARKQAAAFQRFLPRRSIALGAAGREQPQPCTSSSYREIQRQSVASRAPPQRDRGRQRPKKSRPSETKPTCVSPEQALVLEQEISSLLRKEAIKVVPPLDRESGFYSRYFVVPKKDGGLRPILDLRLLNHSVRRLKFRMLTVKQVVSQIRSERLVRHDRSKRRLFPHIHPSQSQEVPEVRFQGQSLPISGSSLRPNTLTPKFHEVRGCCPGSSATPGHPGGNDPLITRFLRGVMRLRPRVRSRVPPWDLAVVLEALCIPPFEPIEEVSR